MEDDDIAAEANRLRLSGWTAPPRAFTPEQSRHVMKLRRLGHAATRPEPDRGFGTLDSRVKEIGLWLATNPGEAGHLPRSYIADRFKLSFDDAGRAVAEAERLLGAKL
jgi:hypothetical protein